MYSTFKVPDDQQMSAIIIIWSDILLKKNPKRLINKAIVTVRENGY